MKETKLDPLDMNDGSGDKLKDPTAGKKRRKMRRKKKKNRLGDAAETSGLSENVAPETLPDVNSEAPKDLKEGNTEVELTTPAKKNRQCHRG